MTDRQIDLIAHKLSFLLQIRKCDVQLYQETVYRRHPMAES